MPSRCSLFSFLSVAIFSLEDGSAHAAAALKAPMRTGRHTPTERFLLSFGGGVAFSGNHRAPSVPDILCLCFCSVVVA